MAETITEALRRGVFTRANGRCEYCLMPAALLLAGCEVDHIISRKHRGITDLSNLALCCARCNRAKGTDVGAICEQTGAFTRLFNPRIDTWLDHFFLDGPHIRAGTDIGEVTVTLLRFNDSERTLERALLQRLAEYPTSL
jgi:hypothetical protein